MRHSKPNEASLASEQRDESLGLGGTLEKLVDHGLVGLLTAARETAKAREQPRIDADRDELFCVRRFGPADAARTLELSVSGFRNIGKINPGVRNMPRALCGSPGGR